ncbi:u5 small nuclear ribonucleoprotein 40 kda protein [Anaeramoeba flamelloides]|uniref:U5 small nuclear ribonucleoprotein 40 kDa protein n=1 Tax=Anaeramoeba flamelloides TaxID=1746091 RepID=A0AAV7ZXP1_9EUKA|nr:u5 small nuclear ribonucleoprotein 40 kda protein [Anaeramoeba flamelloides]
MNKKKSKNQKIAKELTHKNIQIFYNDEDPIFFIMIDEQNLYISHENDIIQTPKDIQMKISIFFLWDCPFYKENRIIWIKDLIQINKNNKNNIFDIIRNKDSLFILSLVNDKENYDSLLRFLNKNLEIRALLKNNKPTKKDIKKENFKVLLTKNTEIYETRKRKGEDLIIACSQDGEIIAIDPQSGKKVKEFVGFGNGVYQTVDYQNTIYGFGGSNEIVCWDFETTKIITRIPTQELVFCGHLEEESGKIFVGSETGNILVLDPERNKIIKEFKSHSSFVEQIDSLDGIVYTSGMGLNERIKSWDSKTYRQLKTYEGYAQGTSGIRIKWNYLITLGMNENNNNQIKVWDLETTELLYFANFTKHLCYSFTISENFIYVTNTSGLITIDVESQLENYSCSNFNFLKFLKNPKFSDLEIFDYPVHKFLVKSRCLKEASEIKTILENNFSKQETFKFLEWVYGKEFNSFSSMNEIQKIFDKLEIHELKTKTLQSDLINSYSDENSKDFSIIVKDQDNNDEDEEKVGYEEEIKVHKFILFTKCGLFQDFFENFAKETNKVQDYSGKSIESIEHFIKYLYFNELKLTGDDDPQLIYEELFDAVDYYQLEKPYNLPNCLKKIKKQYNLN